MYAEIRDTSTGLRATHPRACAAVRRAEFGRTDAGRAGGILVHL